ncbi:hypothetical protein D3C80_1602310 [compost metagenome]
MPECLKPPKGALTKKSPVPPLMETPPVRSLSAMRYAVARSADITAPLRPNFESLARRIASSSLSNPITTPTGPNTSSWASVELLSTLSNRVGSWKKPRGRNAGRLPPATRQAPASSPICTNCSVFCRALSRISGPTTTLGSAGLPNLNWPSTALTVSTKAGRIELCTR